MLAAIFFKMTDKLRSEGVLDIRSMESVMSDNVDPKKLRTNHMTILVKNQMGLKNLYKLVSLGYLSYYAKILVFQKRTSAIPRRTDCWLRLF